MKAPLRIAPLAILVAASLVGCGGSKGSNTVQSAAIVVQPLSVQSVSGTSAVFYVTATGNDLTYQWYKIIGSDSASVDNGSSSTLTLGTVGSGSAGEFYCVVRSGNDSVDSARATLTVVDTAVTPTITSQPVSQTVAVGALATLSVGASGTNLAYQWYKGGTLISGATRANYTLTTASATDVGSYTVTVTNSTLSTPLTSDAATLTVG